MRVGTSIAKHTRTQYKKDHPHACGDKTTTVAPSFVKIGSSPCVWGQETGGASTAKCNRIIPMRVGTSNTQLINCCKYKDHPHACGDKTKEIKENSGFAKSTA